MTSKVQIASMISDTRVERSYETVETTGARSTVTLVEFPTIDDLMLQGMKQVAAEIKFADAEYESLLDRTLVTQLVESRVPITRKS